MESERSSWIDRVINPAVLQIPPYIPGKPVAELERELGITNAIKMASNENPLGPSPRALDALQKHLAESHVYPEDSSLDLRKALAAKFSVRPEQVILGNGSDEIMAMSSHILIRPGCEAILGEHTFSMYRIVVEAFGGKVVRVKMKDHRFDLQAMSAAVTEKTRIIFLALPNNPTGTIFSKADLKSFLGDLPSDRLIVVLDEAYREYVQDQDCPEGVHYLGGNVPVLVLRTFSKLYGLAGLRIGYGIADSWLIELLNRVRPPFNANCLAQKAALAALSDIDHVERTLETTRAGLSYLTTELKTLGLHVIPSQANFLSFTIGPNAKAVYEFLLREGIILRHLASFGMSDSIRVTIGKDHENRRFISALTRLLTSAHEGTAYV